MRSPVNEPGPRAAASMSRSSGRPPALSTSFARRASTGGSPGRRDQSSAASNRRPSRATMACSTPDVSIASRMLEQIPNSLRSAHQRELAFLLTSRLEPDQRRGPRFQDRGTVRPLDECHRVGRRFVEPGVDPGQALQPVQIEVLDWQPTLITVMKDKCRTVHRADDVEAFGDAPDQLGLAGAEVAFEGDHIAGLYDV